MDGSMDGSTDIWMHRQMTDGWIDGLMGRWVGLRAQRTNLGFVIDAHTTFLNSLLYMCSCKAVLRHLFSWLKTKMDRWSSKGLDRHANT
eukprot:scaffold177390_cov35-Prasinocladus_malaysianus.AAC.2